MELNAQFLKFHKPLMSEKVFESNDDRLVTAYISKNVEFKQLPPKLTVSSSIFTSQKINEEQLDKQFGYVSLPSI